MTIRELADVTDDRIYINSSTRGFSNFYDMMDDYPKEEVDDMDVLGIYADDDKDYNDGYTYLYIYC